jgi:hypothetical protein
VKVKQTPDQQLAMNKKKEAPVARRKKEKLAMLLLRINRMFSLFFVCKWE